MKDQWKLDVTETCMCGEEYKVYNPEYSEGLNPPGLYLSGFSYKKNTMCPKCRHDTARIKILQMTGRDYDYDITGEIYPLDMSDKLFHGVFPALSNKEIYKSIAAGI